MRRFIKTHAGFAAVALVIVVFFTFAGLLSVPQETLPAEKGVLNLRGQNIDERHVYKLDGQWEFYWNRLLTHGDFQMNKPDLFADVPNMWTQHKINGKELPGEGYCTYRLHVNTGLKAGSHLGLRINTFSSAYRLYINDSLTAAAGVVTAHPTKGSGQYKPRTVNFQAPASDFDIIVQVSNYDYARGGFWYSLFLGSEESISDYNIFSIAKELFLLGVLVIVAIFNLAMYTIKPELRSYLYSACFCLILAIMIDTVSENTIMGLIPGLSITTATLIWYSATQLDPVLPCPFYG